MQVSTAKFKKNLSDLLVHVAETGERVIVISRGKVRAALISAEELGQLQDLDEAVANWEEEVGDEPIDLDDLEIKLGLDEVAPVPTRKKGSKKRP